MASSLAEDMQIEIMRRLPINDLLACIYCFKRWKSTICSELFKRRYLQLSEKKAMNPSPATLFDRSVNPQEDYTVSETIRGVLCVHSPTTVTLCNPITNSSLSLPSLEEGSVILKGRCYFGLDEGTNVYKVLWAGPINQQKVYTVGTVGPWRAIRCDNHHLATTNGICKRGFVYYGAKIIPTFAPTIMRFRVSTEEYVSTPLPVGVEIDEDSKMVNYKGSVGLVINSATELKKTGGFQIYVSNEDTGEWVLESVVIPGWKENIGNDVMYSFEGTIGTGELVFTAPLLYGSESVLYYEYNTEGRDGRSGFERVTVDAENGGSHRYVRECFNNFNALLPTNN